MAAALQRTAGGDTAQRAAVWEFMRPILSPALVELNRDAFVIDESAETSPNPKMSRPPLRWSSVDSRRVRTTGT